MLSSAISVLENAIFQLKRKLYLELRRSGSKNWPRIIAQMTYNFNARYLQLSFLLNDHINQISIFRAHKSLGFDKYFQHTMEPRPIDLNSKIKAVQLDQVTPKQEATFSENQAYKKAFEDSSSIKIGSYVYVYVPKVRPRGFEVQARKKSKSVLVVLKIKLVFGMP